MRTPRISDGLQIAGFIGVIAGLLLVAYEVRQANNIAKAESIRSMYDGFDTLAISGYSTDIYELYVKAQENPDDLSAAESMRVVDWLTASLQQFDKQLVMERLGLMPFDAINSLLTQFDFYFGNQFSRDWYSNNARNWLEPELVEAIDSEMAVRPILREPPRL
jgi:hypothetical protein